MSTHNMCIYGELMKIIPKLSSNTLLICFTEFVRGNMEQCSLKFHQIMLATISKQQKKATSHAGLNNFSCFQKLLWYRFCTALYGPAGNKRLTLDEVKFDVKFCEIKKIKKRVFKRHVLSYWANIQVGNTEKAVLTNQIWAQRTLLWRLNSILRK